MTLCSFCGNPAEGNHAIHRDGFCDGPEVPLCDACGSKPRPTCEEIWYVTSRHKSVPDRVKSL